MSYLGTTPNQDVTINRKEYKATAGQVRFPAVFDSFVEVSKNGAELSKDDYIKGPGTYIDLVVPANLNDVIQINGYQNISYADATTISVDNTSSTLTGNTIQEDLDELDSKVIAADLIANSTMALSASTVLLSGNLSLSNTINTKNFAAVTYDGNGTTQDIVTGINSVDFTVANNGSGYWLDRTTNEVKTDAGVVVESGSCDWGTNKGVSKVHIKQRNGTGNNEIIDGIRGTTPFIRTNETASEYTIFTNHLISFNNNGFTYGDSSQGNGSGSTYIAYQTLYTHIKWGLTSQNKFYVEAYNPISKEGMIYYIGSGVAGHEIPHSMYVELDWQNVKALKLTDDWHSFTPLIGNGNRLITNSSSAILTGGQQYSDSINVTFGSGSTVNGSNNEYILYYKCASETFTMGTYIGTGVAGNFIETRDYNGVPRRPARVSIKALSSTGDWCVLDNKRNNFDSKIYLNLSNAEGTSSSYSYHTVYDNGFSLDYTHASGNASGTKYIYIVEFDTNNDGGDSYFDYVTDGAVLNVSNGLLAYVDGKSDNNFRQLKETITSANIDFTGISDGYKYIAKEHELDSYKFYSGEPSFTGRYEKQNVNDNRPVLIDGQWYEATEGNLLSNGDFSDGTSTGWNAYTYNGSTYVSSPSVLTVNGSNQAVLTESGSLDYPTMEIVLGCNVGDKVTVEFELLSTNASMNALVSDTSITGSATWTSGEVLASISGDNSVGKKALTFIANSNNLFLRVQCSSSNGGVQVQDNFVAYRVEPTLVPVTNPISFIGKVMVASETPQYIDTSWFMPKVIQENTLINGVLTTNGNRMVMYLEDYGVPQIVNNRRYVIPWENIPSYSGNPDDYDCELKVFYSNVWGIPGFDGDTGTGSNAYGSKAFSSYDGVVVQTAISSVMYTYSSRVMNSFGISVGNSPTSLPAKIIITYKGKTKRI